MKNTAHFGSIGARSGLSARLGSGARFRSSRRPGLIKCKACLDPHRIELDLRLLCRYRFNRIATAHLGHVARDLAESDGIKNGTYAAQLIAEFDDCVAEVQSVVVQSKADGNYDLMFKALDVKAGLLTAKGRALGLGSAAGGKRNGGPADPGPVTAEDRQKVVEAWKATQVNNSTPTGDEVGMMVGESTGPS